MEIVEARYDRKLIIDSKNKDCLFKKVINFQGSKIVYIDKHFLF